MTGKLAGKRITLGVTGGIAVYKAVELLRLFVKAGAQVRVVMTPAATQFVQPLTFRELSYNPVAVDMFAEPRQWLMQHLSLAEGCDVLVVAPATANTLAKIANGIADNLLCTTVLATTVPVVFAPAADSDMWANPITQENVAKLRRLDYSFVGPGQGQLARGNMGVGRMADPAEIYSAVEALLLQAPQAKPQTPPATADMAGKRLLITAGPTREPIDPVRYITNRSSGKMGYALAAAAQKRGAQVTLVSGPVHLPAPAGVNIVLVDTVLEMQNEVLRRFADTDICIGAAAPSDYRAKNPADHKLKKDETGELHLDLVANPDIMAAAGAAKTHQVVVAFAAETSDLKANGLAKLARKKADMVVANDVTAAGAGFDVDTNLAMLLFADGRCQELPLMPKQQLAEIILDRAAAVYEAKNGRRP